MNPALLSLFVVLPLTAAALLVVVRRPALDRGLMVGIPALVTAAAIYLLFEHRETPVLAHNIGGFPGGVSIPLVSDTFSALMIAVTSLTTTVTMAFLTRTGEDRYRFVPSLALMLTAGVNGAFLTGDLFNLFVFVEVMLLPSYALIAVTGTWRRLGIGRLFVVVNLLTSTILLIGVGLVYATAGTVNLAELVGRAAEDPRVGLAISVVLLALAIKAAVAPTHGWLPRAYPATSAGIMALFSAVHTKVALYGIYRIYSSTYDGQAPWAPILAIAVVATILIGSYSTFGEHIMRRALAWQMVAGVGHILLGLALFSEFALAAGIFYMIHHIVTMGALLLASGAIEQTYGSGRYERLAGLARRDKWVAVIYAFALLSLVGLPPSTGFFAKIGLLQASADAGGWKQWVFIATVLIAAVATLLAMQRLWSGVFWGPAMENYRPEASHGGRDRRVPLPRDLRVTWQLASPAAFLVGLQLVFFVLAGALIPIALRAADDLMTLQPYVEAVLG
ncbi:MAG TPA: monovalent cation/H+ antiporter subunit D family protein [Ornithinimicrobium sp.]|uniref:monovalent cation/H+ antiporter subunit D family protein n=1 Tax=Ornithinimicrobium sp. TaxID=1977084 RepID=UPI002B4614F4|nr:monovalent cation/H+ antiporter subunit D family protein [Ornithinimicrobium sp.]HKJ12353.1 monovalent cation/H+ antiporter subunit D family protein [Ornithinimicrobium sp.]